MISTFSLRQSLIIHSLNALDNEHQLDNNSNGQNADENEQSQMNRFIGHGPEAQIEEESNGYHQSNGTNEIDDDPSPSAHAIGAIGVTVAFTVIGINEVCGHNVQGQEKATQGNHSVDVGAIKATQD